MNRMTGSLIALAVAVGLAAWFFQAGDETAPASATAPEQVSLEHPSVVEASSQVETPEAAEDNFGTGIATDAEALRKLNCSAQKHMVQVGNGLATEAYSCNPPEVEDPFAVYSDADLLVMSYSDPEAAKELGKRLLFQNEEGPANEMMLRAVALRPDDISPLQYLVTQTGSLRGPSREARIAVSNAYIISKTASYFDPNVSTNWLRKDLFEHRFTAEDIERLDRLVEGNLARMRAVQIEVFGESRIGEAL